MLLLLHKKVIMFWNIIIFGILFLSGTLALELDDEAYHEMPKLFSLDDYESCLSKKDGVFCMASFELQPGWNVELYYLLKEFSSNTFENYNHMLVHRGVCVSKCIQNEKTNLSIDYRSLFEECVNQRLLEEYGLGAQINDFKYCKKHGDVRQIDMLDWLYAGLAAMLMALNIAGTCADIFTRKIGGFWLRCFSLRANWNRLTYIEDPDNVDGNRNTFSSVHGIKTMTMFLVIFSHVVLVNTVSYIENPRMIERFPREPASEIIINGTLIIQSFFFISGFLLAYNFFSFIEKQNKCDYMYLLHGLLIRYIRLTPSFLFMLGFACTWMAHLGDGPMWQTLVEEERNTCREKFFYEITYLHNLVKGKICLGQAWYLAADVQLYAFGLFILMLIWSKRFTAPSLLAVTLIFSIFLNFYMAFFWGLKPSAFIQTPENLRSVYNGVDSFRLMVTSSVTNLSGYTVGLIGGVLYRSLEVNNCRITDSKWFRMAYMCVLPVGLLLLASVRPLLFAEHSPLTISLYAALSKPMFAVVIAVFTIGNFQQIDSIYRHICEWSEWKFLSRLSYCAMLTHTFPLRIIWGLRMQTLHITKLDTVLDVIGIIVTSYLLAIPLTLTVELPFIQLQKYFISRPKASEELKKRD